MINQKVITWIAIAFLPIAVCVSCTAGGPKTLVLERKYIAAHRCDDPINLSGKIFSGTDVLLGYSMNEKNEAPGSVYLEIVAGPGKQDHLLHKRGVVTFSFGDSKNHELLITISSDNADVESPAKGILHLVPLTESCLVTIEIRVNKSTLESRSFLLNGPLASSDKEHFFVTKRTYRLDERDHRPSEVTLSEDDQAVFKVVASSPREWIFSFYDQQDTLENSEVRPSLPIRYKGKYCLVSIGLTNTEGYRIVPKGKGSFSLALKNTKKNGVSIAFLLPANKECMGLFDSVDIEEVSYGLTL